MWRGLDWIELLFLLCFLLIAICNEMNRRSALCMLSTCDSPYKAISCNQLQGKNVHIMIFFDGHNFHKLYSPLEISKYYHHVFKTLHGYNMTEG